MAKIKIAVGISRFTRMNSSKDSLRDMAGACLAVVIILWLPTDERVEFCMGIAYRQATFTTWCFSSSPHVSRAPQRTYIVHYLSGFPLQRRRRFPVSLSRSPFRA